MNNYTKQGKGRNPVLNPRTGVAMYYAGFGHRLLASAIPEMRDAYVSLLPCYHEPQKSLRARRRQDGEELARRRPVGFRENVFNRIPEPDPYSEESSLARISEMIRNAPLPAITTSAERARALLAGITPEASAERIRRSFPVAPQGVHQYFTGMDFAAAEDRVGAVVIDSLSQLRERGLSPTGRMPGRTTMHNAVVQMANAASQMAAAFGTSVEQAAQSLRQMGDAGLTIDTEGAREALRESFRTFAVSPDSRVRLLPDEGRNGYTVLDLENSYDPTWLPSGPGIGGLANAEARIRAEKYRAELAKAEEQRKIKERLAGREVGQVVRRPKRTVAGFTVIDAMAEDGTVARTIVKSGEK